MRVLDRCLYSCHNDSDKTMRSQSREAEPGSGYVTDGDLTPIPINYHDATTCRVVEY